MQITMKHARFGEEGGGAGEALDETKGGCLQARRECMHECLLEALQRRPPSLGSGRAPLLLQVPP